MTARRLAVAVAVVAAAACLLGAAAADPVADGVARYRAGDWQAAATAFARSSDPVASYDLGCALARAGRYAAALAAFQTALARHPEDADARANAALMRRLLGAATARAAGQAGAAGARVARRDIAAPKAPVDSSGAAGLVGTRRGRATAMALGRSTVAPPRDPAPEAGRGQGGEARGSATAGAGASGAGHGLAPETTATRPVLQAPVATAEQRQATEQWLATVPDDSARFLRLRLLVEQARRQQAGTAMPPADDPW